MSKKSTKTKAPMTVEDTYELFNRVLDVEAARLAKIENRPYKDVRSESVCELKDGYITLHLSKTMAERMEYIFQLAREDRLSEKDD